MTKLNCKGKLLSLDVPVVMGVLNVTPDSFFDGGRFNRVEAAVEQARKMVYEGAGIIDVGGMSSRPGAEIIEVEEEKARVLPVIEAIQNSMPEVILSIDTVHSEVAESAIKAGASMINDISGGNIDEKIWGVAISNDVPYILMHMQGRPGTMQNNPVYKDVCLDILKILRDKVHALRSKGQKDIIVDPGFGFGKSIEQNYELLKGLSSFRILDCPILAGVSRKSMIYKLLKNTPGEALNGTTASHMIALQEGASLLRVHDVKEAVECVKIYNQTYG